MTSHKLGNGKKELGTNNRNFTPVPFTHLQQILYAATQVAGYHPGLVTNAEPQVPPQPTESIFAF